MPIHDWKPQHAWIFHDFRHGWLSELARVLNRIVLPSGYYALIERWAGNDFELDARRRQLAAVSEMELYDPPAPKPHSAVTVRREQDDCLIAACDIAVPDYESGEVDVMVLARRGVELLLRRVHLLVVDLLPPAPRYRGGFDDAVRMLLGTPANPTTKPLMAASYQCRGSIVPYLNPLAAGDVLPDMPLFLAPGWEVPVPLETTYLAAWEGVPGRCRALLEPKPN